MYKHDLVEANHDLTYKLHKCEFEKLNSEAVTYCVRFANEQYFNRAGAELI